MENDAKFKEVFQGFLKGEKMSTITCRNAYHTTELRSIVSKIQRVFGVTFSKSWEKDECGNRYKLYWLSQEQRRAYYDAHMVQSKIEFTE